MLFYKVAVTAATGLHVSRTTSAESLSLAEVRLQNAKYVLKCTNGHLIVYNRETKAVQCPEFFRCKCGASLKRIR